jgi:predicted ester cyclase
VELPIVDGERVAQVATVTGTDTGGFMGLPPTGKKFSLPMVFLFTIRNGLIQHERRMYDFTGLMIQLGVLKAKPA